MATKTKSKSAGWSVEKASKATDKHRYLHITDTGGTSEWALTAAPDYWAKGFDYVYIPNRDVRLAGERQKVINAMRALTNNVVSLGDIQTFIEQNGFTINNRQAKAALIDQLIEQQKAFDANKKAKKTSEPGYSLDQVRAILGAYTKGADVHVDKKVKGKGGHVESLYDKVQKLNAENANKSREAGQWKVLNVTNMDKDGKLARRMPYNPKGKMILIGQLPIVVNKGAANAAAAYNAAIDLLSNQSGVDYSGYKQLFLQTSTGSSIVTLISSTQQAPQVQMAAVRTQLTPNQPFATMQSTGLPQGLPLLPTMQ